MSRVLTFSTKFPAYHPKKNEPTFFVEKIYKSLFLMKSVPPELVDSYNFEIMNDDTIAPKHHTIRKGNRWKVGDRFSARVWGTDVNPKSGKSGPYQSKQIEFASDVEVKKVWNIKISKSGNIKIEITDGDISLLTHVLNPAFEVLSKNDGLNKHELYAWFKMPCKFTGQIICWSDQINY